MTTCICNWAKKRKLVKRGNDAWQALKSHRVLAMGVCKRCKAKWIEDNISQTNCPECNFASIAMHCEQAICPLHGVRGPQTTEFSNMLRAMRPIEREGRNVNYYVQRLKVGQPFTHARYNDGEWLTLFGYYTFRNSNKCTFEKGLSVAMIQALKNNRPYDHALLSHALWRYGLHIKEFLERHKIKVKWVKGDVILNGMLSGDLFPMMEQIRKYKVLYVGPVHTRRLERSGFFPLADHVLPPAQNAHRDKKRILAEVMSKIEKHGINFVGWSSGLASKVFIDDVFEMTAGEITQVDFGSSFDGFYKPLPHVKPGGSRSYIRKGKRNWELILRQNIEGK
jgi:hypothetical protein